MKQHKALRSTSNPQQSTSDSLLWQLHAWPV